MPKLPDIWSVPPPSFGGGGFVPHVPQARLIPRGTGLQAIGKGIAEAGAGLAAMFKRMEAKAKQQQHLDSQTQILAAQLAVQRTLNQLYQDGLNSNDPGNATSTYRNSARSAIEEAAQAIADPRVRENFILKNAIGAEQHALHISNESYKRVMQDHWDADNKTLDDMHDQAIRDPNHLSDYVGAIDRQIEMMREKYHFSPSTAETLRRRASSNIGLGLGRIESRRDPQKLNDELRQWIDSGVPEDQRAPGPRGGDPFYPTLPKPLDFPVPNMDDEEDRRAPRDDTEGDDTEGDDTQSRLEDTAPIRLASLDYYPLGRFNSPGGVPGTGINPGAEGVDAQIGNVHSLAEQRQIAFGREVRDPRVMALVAANMEAEVGKENPNGKLGYIEVIMNRALSRGQSLEEVVSRPEYYDKAGRTHRLTLTPGFGADQIPLLQDLVGQAMRGSNITNYATGNESGRGHQPGTTDADITVNLGPGHERYLREQEDRGWWSRMLSYGNHAMPLGGAADPVRIRSDDMNFLEQRGGHEDRLQGESVPQFAPEMAARLRAAGEAYERETGRRAEFGAMSRSHERQVQYRADYLAGVGGLAAPAGQSRHERGLAVDIPKGPFLDYLHANAQRFGLSYRVWYRTGKDAGHTEMSDGQTVEPGREAQARTMFVPAESGRSGPLRLAALGPLTGYMFRADPGHTTGTVPLAPPRRVAEADVSRETRPRTGVAQVQSPGPAERIPYGPVKGVPHLLEQFNGLGATRPLGPGEYITLPNGAMANEMTYTTEVGGKNRWGVVPGLWIVNGVPTHVTEDQAGEYAERSGLNWKIFPTVQAAEKFANDREAVWERTPHGRTDAQPALWTRPNETPIQRALREGFEQGQAADAQRNQRIREGRPVGPEPVTPPPGHSEPINPDGLVLPKRRQPGEPGFNPKFDNMNPEDIYKLILANSTALAKDHQVSTATSIPNFLAIKDMITSGKDINGIKKYADASLLAASRGDPVHGITQQHWNDIQRMIRDRENATTAEAKAKIRTEDGAMHNFFGMVSRPEFLKTDPQENVPVDPDNPLSILQPQVTPVSRLPPEQVADARRRNYEFEMNVEREMAALRALKLDPTDLFKPDKPNYIGPRADGSRSPMDAYKENPNIIDREGTRIPGRYGPAGFPWQLDPERAGELKIKSIPGELIENYNERVKAAAAKFQDTLVGTPLPPPAPAALIELRAKEAQQKQQETTEEPATPGRDFGVKGVLLPQQAPKTPEQQQEEEQRREQLRERAGAVWKKLFPDEPYLRLRPAAPEPPPPAPLRPDMPPPPQLVPKTRPQTMLNMPLPDEEEA
jgi:hypothetical protein